MSDSPSSDAWPQRHQAEAAGKGIKTFAECPYIELQALSNFSFLRGGSHPEELIVQAAALGYPALALTDKHSLAGIVRAHVAAKKVGVRLIIGSSVPLFRSVPKLTPEITHQEEVIPSEYPEFLLPFSILLYPSSKHAYGNLSSLLTTGKLRAPKGACFITLDDLAAANQGLLAVITIQSFHDKELLNYLSKLKTIFSHDRLSLALTYTYGPDNQRRMHYINELHTLLNIPLVATNDVHYHEPERRKLQDVLCCIKHGTTLSAAGFLLLQNAERHLKDPEEMARLFRSLPQALRRSKEIAALALQFSMDELRYEYPKEICPETKTPTQYLRELTYQGAVARYPQGLPEKVGMQLEHELQLIKELGYEKYFLTVYDIVQFARSEKILCQGRGAAANSATCYVLGITAVDPDKINLLFERFISKERNEPPDIDIDFEHERREEVIQYIYKKYGRLRAALTAEVVSYRTRSAVRDIGKVFSLSLEEIEQVIKLLTRSEEAGLNQEDFLKRDLDPRDTRVQQTLHFVAILRGFPRHLSQHVGGFIISETPLSEIVPIENASMPGRTVIEWDKDDVDAMGMLKIDILGLGMLTMIRKALQLINEQRLLSPSTSDSFSHDELLLHNIPPEDPQVYEMISQADTVGVFQIESRAQMSMLPRLRPQCFYDLVIEVAIVRPGPIQGGMVHPYLRRRQGLEKVSYPNKKIEKILAPTLGVPIFQEQVMELAVVAAEFSPGEADQLRRAMASWKKNKNLMSTFGTKLLGGMRKNGYSREFAERVFNQIKGFGEYGFPQSHAASFALLVYVSAWIKKHYPATFAAGLLNSQPMGFYQPAQIIRDAKEHGVRVLPIDIKRSEWDCTLEQTQTSDPHLRLGFRLIRGLSVNEATRISETQLAAEASSSLKEFWRKSKLSVATLKKLARADAFHSYGISRQRALWEIATFRDAALPLFSKIVEEEPFSPLPLVSQKGEVIRDYNTLGLSLKAHPLSFVRSQLSRWGTTTAKEITKVDKLSGMRVRVSGLVLVRQRPMTASGVMFMTIEDETGICNLIVRPKVFEYCRDQICDSVAVLASGKLQKEQGVTHIIVEKIKDISPLLQEIRVPSRDFH